MQQKNALWNCTFELEEISLNFRICCMRSCCVKVNIILTEDENSLTTNYSDWQQRAIVPVNSMDILCNACKYKASCYRWSGF